MEVKNNLTAPEWRWEGKKEWWREGFQDNYKDTWTEPRGGGIRGQWWGWLQWGGSAEGCSLYLNNNEKREKEKKNNKINLLLS